MLVYWHTVLGFIWGWLHFQAFMKVSVQQVYVWNRDKNHFEVALVTLIVQLADSKLLKAHRKQSIMQNAINHQEGGSYFYDY